MNKWAGYVIAGVIAAMGWFASNAIQVLVEQRVAIANLQERVERLERGH